MAAEEITLDVCDLEPPEPYELATAALKKLRSGQYLRLIIPRRPRLLYPWLTEHGFSEVTSQSSDDLYELFIWSADDRDTAQEITQRFA